MASRHTPSTRGAGTSQRGSARQARSPHRSSSAMSRASATLVVWIEGDSLSSRQHGRGQIAFPARVLDKVSRRPSRSCPRRVRSAESSVPAPGTHSTRNSHRGMRRDTVGELARPAPLQAVQRGHVTPHRAGLERERFVTMAIEDANTELAAEKTRQATAAGPPERAPCRARAKTARPRSRGGHPDQCGWRVIGEKGGRFGWARIERTARPSIPFRSSVPACRNSIIQPPPRQVRRRRQVTLRSRLGH